MNIDTSKLNKEIVKIQNKFNKEVLNATKRSLRKIGKTDLKKLKAEQLNSLQYLKVKSKGLKKSFKYKLIGRDLSDLYLSEYTRWKAAPIFQTGGVVVAKKKLIPIFFDGAKVPKTIFSSKIESGDWTIFTSKGGNIIIYSRTEKKPIGVLKRQIIQKKRLAFFKNSEQNSAEHTQILDTEFDKSLRKLMAE